MRLRFVQYSERYGTNVIKAMLLMSDSPYTLRTLGVDLESVIRLNRHSRGYLVTTHLPVNLLPEVANMRNVIYIHAASPGSIGCAHTRQKRLRYRRESGMEKQPYLHREGCCRRYN